MTPISIALTSVTLIVGWAFLALMALDYVDAATRWLDEPGNHVRVGLWTAAIIVTGLAWLAPDESWLGDLAPELTGLAITVIVIDELGRYRAALQYKRDVLDQIGSNVNDAALEALRLASKNGWVKDGSLVGGTLFMANLQGAFLMGPNLRNVDLTLANLDSAELLDANLEGATLASAKLEGAILSNPRRKIDAQTGMTGCVIRSRAKLKDAYLGGANLNGAVLRDTILQGAKLFDATFKGADLTFAKLNDADLRDSNLEGADLLYASLKKAQLLETNLREARLFDANLDGADLRYANLDRADLEYATLEGATCNNATVWPEGFDYKAAGVINVDEEGEGGEPEHGA